MEAISKQKKLGVAALRADMHRNTARKYVRAGKLPSELKSPRQWRTRVDPFAADWDEITARLQDAPELEAWILLEDLEARKPGLYSAGQVRTLQRRIRRWRAQEGPPKEVFFAQEHRPGEAMQTDFTWMTNLEVTIAGEAFPHLLCHPVLPYSNWEWATVCHSESLLALRHGIQAALFRLGRVPEFHQTDNSTAATHKLAPGQRGFNEEYEAMMRYLGMKPRTIAVGKSNQNGDVEAANKAVKNRVKQHLLLRRSRDFESVAIYEKWLENIYERANRLRAAKLKEELAQMRPLEVKRLPEYNEARVLVSSWNTIRVKNNAYSVPARLIGEHVQARIFDNRIEVYFAGVQELQIGRLLGEGGHRINYRHVILSLVRKPGAFARYVYREDMFPTPVFRRAYDALSAAASRGSVKGDLEYLRILYLAATTMESDVEAALELLYQSRTLPTSDRVKALVCPRVAEIPEMPVPQVDLAIYDELLSIQEVAA